MDIKSRILGRAKPKSVEFLSKFQNVSFSPDGVGQMMVDASMVLPIEAALLVPVDKMPQYNNTMGVSCSVDASGVITIVAEDWGEFLAIGCNTLTTLVSVAATYNARGIQQLIPSEVRVLTNSSAEVMQMLTAKDPTITERLTASITQRIGKEKKNFDMGTALEAALNVELTMKHPELLEEIEMLQQLQPAIQLAVMLGADTDFVKTIYRYIPEGSSMVSELLSFIDPPVMLRTPTPDEDADPNTGEEIVDVIAATPISALDDALQNDHTDDFDDDGNNGDYMGDTMIDLT